MARDPENPEIAFTGPSALCRIMMREPVTGMDIGYDRDHGKYKDEEQSASKNFSYHFPGLSFCF